MNRAMPIAASVAAVLAAVALTGCSAVRHFVEQPDYEVVEDEGRLELRRYAATVVAEVDAEGERYDSVNRSFSPLADYIFGANRRREKIAMTSPVSQAGESAEGEKIAMTSPVSQQDSGGGRWTVRFTMPAKYKLEDLPEPTNPAVRLREVPPRTFAVIRFSGDIEEADFAGRLDSLRAWVEARSLRTAGEPVYAYYDPPWTLSFLRRNEIMIEVAEETADATAPVR